MEPHRIPFSFGADNKKPISLCVKKGVQEGNDFVTF